MTNRGAFAATEAAQNAGEEWRCHARPAPSGKTCGYLNTKPVTYLRLVVCAECGCTKIASDARAAKEGSVS